MKTIEEVVNDPHLKERDMIVELDHPEFGQISVPGQPIRLSRSELPDITLAPSKGEDNQEVFRECLGLSEEDLRRLEFDGVI